VGRFWSLLFLLVPILGVGTFVWALNGWYGMEGHWLPENINEYGLVIDQLFMFILYLTGVIFVGTGVALVWVMWKYDRTVNTQPVVFTHGSHTLEVVWSVLPAATLLFIAIYQMNAWADAKMRHPTLGAGVDMQLGTEDDELMPPLAEITGRQFEWRIRYAGQDGVIGTPDDVHVVTTSTCRSTRKWCWKSRAWTCCTASFCPTSASSRTSSPA